MIQKEPMKTGRYNAALALLSDRFIFCLGGFISKDKACDVVEVLDTRANIWHPVTNLNKARGCTSACTVASRYIYVFPGQQKDTLNTIEFLDVSSPMVNP